MKFTILALSILCLTVVSADNDKKGHKPYERQVSDFEHHEGDGEHDENDLKYDHDAFLGKDEASKFEEMSPEESKERLGEIVDKIDKDGDKKVTQEELRQWIHSVAQKSMNDDVQRSFEASEPKDGKIVWDVYLKHNYGSPEERTKDEEAHVKENIARDEKKWKAADQDGDGALSMKEYTSFIHPEEAPHMRSIVIDEAMHEMDKDKDGFVSLDEYLNDHWTATEEDPKEPTWLKGEREKFAKERDTNSDGRLDLKELGNWLVPENQDQALSEAKHLIMRADSDNDGVLTKEEILKNHELFAGSQATDFGQRLNSHEEL